ncbi:MAG: PfkB family carbohydrate kinase [Bradyrhizobium sp.]|nr:PfkB family carbohydrate kinase [Bradyrhizobium sp.]
MTAFHIEPLSTASTVVESKSLCSKDSALLIAGGVYIETCVTPARVTLLGSGGRAALALLGLRDDIDLHTFHPHSLEQDVALNFEPLGVRVTVHPTPSRYSFEYLHPLARPRIVPLPSRDVVSVAIEAEEVLRYGCLEGDFRVTAKRAVYDPQSGMRPIAFGDNGSTAERLALVLNGEEIRHMAGEGDIAVAAASMMRHDCVTAIVVKDGPFGAYVFEEDGPSPRHVPAYPTRSVYKIGSGDVFSATFAHAWLPGEISAADAADLASRRTADYVESPAFPLPRVAAQRAPASVGSGRRRVLLASARTATSSRWLQEEAIEGLAALGAAVVLDESFPGQSWPPAAAEGDFDLVLILLRDTGNAVAETYAALAHGKSVVAFVDDPTILDAIRGLGVIAEDDLCSALYRTQWIPT